MPIQVQPGWGPGQGYAAVSWEGRWDHSRAHLSQAAHAGAFSSVGWVERQSISA